MTADAKTSLIIHGRGLGDDFTRLVCRDLDGRPSARTKHMLEYVFRRERRLHLEAHDRDRARRPLSFRHWGGSGPRRSRRRHRMGRSPHGLVRSNGARRMAAGRHGLLRSLFTRRLSMRKAGLVALATLLILAACPVTAAEETVELPTLAFRHRPRRLHRKTGARIGAALAGIVDAQGGIRGKRCTFRCKTRPRRRGSRCIAEQWPQEPERPGDVRPDLHRRVSALAPLITSGPIVSCFAGRPPRPASFSSAPAWAAIRWRSRSQVTSAG